MRFVSWRTGLRHVGLGCLAASTFLGGGTLLHAQTTSYTAKELRSCQSFFNGNLGWGASTLSENGDVVGQCSYVAGYRWVFTGSWQLTKEQDNRLVVWPQGGAPTLLSPNEKYHVRGDNLWGIDASGYILARTSPGARNNGVEQLAWWKGSTRTSWAPVPDAAASDWHWTRVTPGGKVAGYRNPPSARLIVAARDRPGAQDIPLPPQPGLTGGLPAGVRSVQIANVVTNDQGAIALTTFTAMEGQADDVTNLWHWDGARWRDATPPVLPQLAGYVDNVTMRLANINASGTLAFSQSGYQPHELGGQELVHVPRLWHPQSGLTVLPDSYNGYFNFLAVTDEGPLHGSLKLGRNEYGNTQARAVLVRDGQVIDLNTLIAPPSGYVFESVMARNGKGQLLVRMTTSTGASPIRYWLFTPR